MDIFNFMLKTGGLNFFAAGVGLITALTALQYGDAFLFAFNAIMCSANFSLGLMLSQTYANKK